VGVIEEVHGEHGDPPYVVRWEDGGSATVIFPGADARVEHPGHDRVPPSREPSPERAGTAAETDPEVLVPASGVSLPGSLAVPSDAIGIVIFAHGSGSSRRSPRNRHVASELNDRGIATLLLDLLTPDEEPDRRHVFDMDLLAGRLAAATAWVREHASTRGLPVGYFGASTGAGAALVAAAEPGAGIAAIVSRGGRPDLAGAKLPAVTAPTLLIVGGADDEVLTVNRMAQARMRCPNRLEIVAGATHLFEEPGALDSVAALAGAWFSDHLARPRDVSAKGAGGDESAKRGGPDES